MKKLVLCVAISLIGYTFLFAQEPKESASLKKWEFGLNAGVANFAGEYNMYKEAQFNHFNHWDSDYNLGFGAFIKKNFSNVFALEGAWNYSTLSGAWKGDSRPINDFKTILNEFGVNTVWNMNNLFASNKFDRKFYWYTKIGIGIGHVNEKVGTPAQKDDYWKVPAIPLGTGFAIRLGERMHLNLGTQWTWINTDRLDARREDIGGNPPNRKPGNTENDIFGTKLYTHAGLSFRFGKNRKPAVVELPQATPAAAPAPKPSPEPKPEAKVEPTVVGNVYTLHFGLNFGFNRWDLDEKSATELDRLVKDMTNNPDVNVEIKSHTDSRGPAAYNMTLSEKRGKSVSDYLISKGIAASRISAQAFGETQLINQCADGVPCTNAEHSVNRRSECTLVVQKK